MSSFARRLELKILREKKAIPQRHKATVNMRGKPWRHGYHTIVDGKEVFIRYH